MKTFAGVVENGVVKLPPNARLRDGSRVILMVVGRTEEGPAPARDAGIEAEDAPLAEACRGNINEAVRDEEA